MSSTGERTAADGRMQLNSWLMFTVRGVIGGGSAIMLGRKMHW